MFYELVVVFLTTFNDFVSLRTGQGCGVVVVVVLHDADRRRCGEVTSGALQVWDLVIGSSVLQKIARRRGHEVALAAFDRPDVRPLLDGNEPGGVGRRLIRLVERGGCRRLKVIVVERLCRRLKVIAVERLCRRLKVIVVNRRRRGLKVVDVFNCVQHSRRSFS